MTAPKFKIPLTAGQTLEVGRLSVIWGQIDHFVMSSISLLLTTDLAAAVTLMGDLTTGRLVNKLKKSRHRITDREIRELTKKFCDDMGPLIEARNHITHGMWGLHIPGTDPSKAKPGCMFVNRDNPVFPEKVTEVANKAAEQTHVISRIWHHLSGKPFPDGNPKFYFGNKEPKPPKGMRIEPIAYPPKRHRPPRGD